MKQGAQLGGWIPVVKARGRPGPWRMEGSVGVFTVFVDNLPASLNPKVKPAEFGKDKVDGEATRIPLSTQVRRPIVHAAQGGDGKTGANGLRDKRSYVEAVAGKRAGEIGSILLKVEEIGNEWLFESISIKLKAQYANISLKRNWQ
ncbi:hypothetical protein ACSBR2_028267 [Camellia fascicularis]